MVTPINVTVSLNFSPQRSPKSVKSRSVSQYHVKLSPDASTVTITFLTEKSKSKIL